MGPQRPLGSYPGPVGGEEGAHVRKYAQAIILCNVHGLSPLMHLCSLCVAGNVARVCVCEYINWDGEAEVKSMFKSAI